MECLPGPPLPGELKGRGSGITAIGEGERIPPSAIVQRVIRKCGRRFRADGGEFCLACCVDPSNRRHFQDRAIRLRLYAAGVTVPVIFGGSRTLSIGLFSASKPR